MEADVIPDLVYFCEQCNSKPCNRGWDKYPTGCPTKNEPELISKATEPLAENEKIRRIYDAYARLHEDNAIFLKNRMELTCRFLYYYGAKTVGVAPCGILIKSAGRFAAMLREMGITPYVVGCKVGAMTPESVGIQTDDETWFTICNPLAQAELMNVQKTDFNVSFGLCVGHDTIFEMLSDAPVTTLVTKDMVTNNNPNQCLVDERRDKPWFRDAATPLVDKYVPGTMAAWRAEQEAADSSACGAGGAVQSQPEL